MIFVLFNMHNLAKLYLQYIIENMQICWDCKYNLNNEYNSLN